MTDSAKETTPTTAPSKPAKKKVDYVEGKIQENEIRVTAQGKMRNYVAYAATIFSEGKSHTVVLKGMGRVINKTVSLAEILKRRVKGLYQLAEIGSIQVVDKKSGKSDGEPTEVVRLLSVIKIVLTTEPEDKAKYQVPVDESQVEPLSTSTPRKGKENRNRKKAKAFRKIESEAKEETPTEKAVEPPPAAEDTKPQEAIAVPVPVAVPVDSKEETLPTETGEASDDKKINKKAKRRNFKKAKKAKKEAADKETEVKDGTPSSKEAKKEKPAPTKETKKAKPAPTKETKKEKSPVEAAAPAPETVSA